MSAPSASPIPGGGVSGWASGFAGAAKAAAKTTARAVRSGAHGAGDVTALAACVSGVRLPALLRMFQSTFESACAEVSATLFHGLFASVGNGRGFDDVMAKIILGVFVVPMLIPIWAPLVLLDWFGRASVGTFRIAGAPALLVYAALRRVERDDPEMKHRVMFWARVGALGVAATLALVVAAENADVARANRSDEREDDDEREEGSDERAASPPREGEGPVE
jgi:hypothetical protein